MSDELDTIERALRPLRELHLVARAEGAMDRPHAVSFIGSLSPEDLQAARAALAAVQKMREREPMMAKVTDAPPLVLCWYPTDCNCPDCVPPRAPQEGDR